MNQKETVQILMLMKSEYPAQFRDLGKTELTLKAKMWTSIFTEPYEDVISALQTFIANDIKGFAPKPGDLKAIIYPNNSEEKATQLVDEIINAARRISYVDRSEFERFLSKDAQRLAGSYENLKAWAIMDEGTVQSVIRSQLLRSARQIAENNRNNLLLGGGNGNALLLELPSQK